MCWDLSELVQAFEENMIGSERAKDFKWLASLLLWLIVGTLSAFQSCASSSCVTAHKLKKQMSSGKYARNTSQDSVFTSKRNSFHFAVNFLATSGRPPMKDPAKLLSMDLSFTNSIPFLNPLRLCLQILHGSKEHSHSLYEISYSLLHTCWYFCWIITGSWIIMINFLSVFYFSMWSWSWWFTSLKA